MMIRKRSLGERVFWLTVYYTVFVNFFIAATRAIFTKIEATDHLAILTLVDWLVFGLALATAVLFLGWLISKIANPWAVEEEYDDDEDYGVLPRSRPARGLRSRRRRNPMP